MAKHACQVECGVAVITPGLDIRTRGQQHLHHFSPAMPARKHERCEAPPSPCRDVSTLLQQRLYCGNLAISAGTVESGVVLMVPDLEVRVHLEQKVWVTYVLHRRHFYCQGVFLYTLAGKHLF